MNATEQRYADHLDLLLHEGKIVWWAFEPMKFRLADNTFYTPDFGLMAPSGLIEMHEVKGFWQDDARVKIKVAASLYPFQFVGVYERPKKHGGGYEHERF